MFRLGRKKTYKLPDKINFKSNLFFETIDVEFMNTFRISEEEYDFLLLNIDDDDLNIVSYFFYNENSNYSERKKVIEIIDKIMIK